MKTRRGNGEGSFYFSESKGRWVGQKVVGFKPDGTPNRLTVYGKTKSETVEKLKIKEQEAAVCPGMPKKTTIADIVEMRANDDLNANVIKQTTYNRRLHTLKIIKNRPLDAYGNTFATLKVSDITEMHIKTFFNSLTEYSNSVISKVSVELNAAFKYALKKKLISENPIEDIRPPQRKTNPKGHCIDRKRAKTVHRNFEWRRTLLPIPHSVFAHALHRNANGRNQRVDG